MTPIVRLSRTIVLALMFLMPLATGCVDQKWTVESTVGELARIPMPRRGPPVVVIAPLDVPESWTSDETFKRASQLTDLFAARGWLVVAPWEYQVRNATSPTALVQQEDVLQATKDAGVHSSQLWVLTVKMSESKFRQITEADDGEGNVAEASRSRTLLIVDLHLHDPRLDRALGGVTANIEQNPFDPQASDVDVLPNLTDALPDTVAGLTDAMDKQQAGPDPAARLSGRFQFNPHALGSYVQGQQESLNERLAGFGEVEQLARKVRHYQFFMPFVGIDDIKRYEALPSGIDVLDPGQLSGNGLKRGDFIVEIEGIPVSGLHALRRAFVLRNTISIRVLRNGESKSLTVSI